MGGGGWRIVLLDRSSPGLLALSWPSKSLSPKLAFSPRLCTALLWAVTFAGETICPPFVTEVWPWHRPGLSPVATSPMGLRFPDLQSWSGEAPGSLTPLLLPSLLLFCPILGNHCTPNQLFFSSVLFLRPGYAALPRLATNSLEIQVGTGTEQLCFSFPKN